MILTSSEAEIWKKKLLDIIVWYEKKLDENTLSPFDWGYASILFRLAGKILNRPPCEALARELRDKTADALLKTKFPGFLFNAHGANVIAMQAWSEMGESAEAFEDYRDILQRRFFDRAQEELREPMKFEILYGAVGLSLIGHALEAKDVVRACDDYLEKHLVEMNGMAGYLCKANLHDEYYKDQANVPRFNLGLAHGQPGVLCYSVYRGNERLAKRIGESLLQIAELNGDCPFPTHWPPYNTSWTPDERFYRERSAWCYGDAGVGFAQLCYSERMNGAGREVALSTLRRGLDERQWGQNINDGHFCHGSAGMAQIALRSYSLAKEEFLLTQAHYWLNKLNAPIEALAVLPHAPAEYRKNAPPLLMGLLGIGLVLCSFLNEEDFQWDRIFLMSPFTGKSE